MIEVTFFGVLVGTLVSGLSVVLVLVALGATAHLGFTAAAAARRLGPSANGGPGVGAEGGAPALSVNGVPQRLGLGVQADLAANGGPGVVGGSDGLGATGPGVGLALHRPDGALSAGTALRARGQRWSTRNGVFGTLMVLALALAGLRFHDPASAVGTWLFTFAVALTASTAAGAWCAALSLSAFRSLASAADQAAARRAKLEGARQANALHVETKTTQFLAGDDLREEVQKAETALSQLGTALAALEGIASGLSAKRALGDLPLDQPALATEHTELENDIESKVTLGRRIRDEAEIAVFRLRCLEPLRRLVRRRPREATAGLGNAAASREALAASVQRAVPAVQRFLEEAAATRETLASLEVVRPAHLDPADADDPLGRAKRELATIDAAYVTVLRRVEAVRLRLDADAGLREMANAAGALSPSPQLAGLDETELDRLIEEVSQADAALSIGVPGDVEANVVSDALARGAAALQRNDGTSLADLTRAMKEIE